MSQNNTRLGNEQQEVMACLGRMRETIKRLTDAAPSVLTLTLELRHEMIELTSRVTAMQCTQAAQRMTGEAPPLTQTSRIDDTTLFLKSLHRAGDHTLDDGEEVQP